MVPHAYYPVEHLEKNDRFWFIFSSIEAKFTFKGCPKVKFDNLAVTTSIKGTMHEQTINGLAPSSSESNLYYALNIGKCTWPLSSVYWNSSVFRNLGFSIPVFPVFGNFLQYFWNYNNIFCKNKMIFKYMAMWKFLQCYAPDFTFLYVTRKSVC